MGKKKTPHFKPNPKQVPQHGINTDATKKAIGQNRLQITYPDKSPKWSFQLLDHDGPFGWHRLHISDVPALCTRLAELEKHSWTSISSGTGSHFIDSAQIVADARKRLIELKLDSHMDEIYSIRICGKQRVYGINNNNIFYFLWWDPEHEICPGKWG